MVQNPATQWPTDQNRSDGSALVSGGLGVRFLAKTSVGRDGRRAPDCVPVKASLTSSPVKPWPSDDPITSIRVYST